MLSLSPFGRHSNGWGILMRTARISCVLMLALFLFTSLATAEIVLDPGDISWSTENEVVTFALAFFNDGTEPSEPQVGVLSAQEFGAFLPNIMTIQEFDLPPIPPDSFFDVFVEIPYDQLPPSAEEYFDWGGMDKDDTCANDWHWDGNVDVYWMPAGAPSVHSHIGTINVCPGYGGSYIHLVTGCNGNITWAFTGVGAGFTASLLDETFLAAPAVLLPGFTGWIGISAVTTVPFGTVSNITLTLTCNGVPVPILLAATACDCGPVPIEKSTWGTFKAIYR